MGKAGGQVRSTFENKGPVANQVGQQTIRGDMIINQSLNENPLDLLPFVTQAAFDASEKEDDPLCLPGTRVDLLQQIRAWADGNDEGYIFWLSGWAGTGKSTIARTVAYECYDKGCLGASFFFSRGKEDVSRAGKFSTTIALQLAANFPVLGDLIHKAASANHNITNKTQKEQWKLLIREPLSKLEVGSLQLPLVLVIDALDECEDDNDIKRILDLFFEAKAIKTVRLRIFVTSRPQTPIRLKFHKLPGIFHQDLVLHDTPQETKDRDILIFFEHRFGAIRNESGGLSDDWPGRQYIDKLVSTAHGLFIYAATVCRFIENGIYDYPADDLLRLVLPDENIANTSRQRSGNITTHESPTEVLDMMYTQALEHSLGNARHEKDKEQLTGICRQILSAVVILFDPLPPIALAKFLGIDDEIVGKRLNSLRAILDVPEKQEWSIRLLHPSFRDFLLDDKRCRTQHFWVEEKKAHSAMADCCVRLMSDQLRRDICGLNAAGTLTSDVQGDIINHCLPTELQYACLYWVRHLQKSETALSDHGFVYTFLCQHLLHWLEVMSLIRKTSELVRAIASLESIVKVDQSPCLHALIHDAKRFVLYNRSIIEEAPLQTYWSALFFAPQQSLVRMHFKNEMPSEIKMLGEVQRQWSSLLQTLEGHTRRVHAVAFSPVGKTVASASDDETVRLWDAETGAALQMLKGHTRRVRAVAFSSDGKMVASASDDATVRLWDAETGAALQTLKGHTSMVIAVAFSPDGKAVASTSGDTTVRLWNVETGAAVQTLKGHTNIVNAVAFSPDSKIIASISGDATVRLWNAETGAALQTLKGHTYEVNAVAFSPDGKTVVSVSYDATVRLWDAETGAALQTLKGHTSIINAVAFSPNGKTVASVSDDATVRLWDAETGAALQTLKGHISIVNAVAFSPDSKTVVSVSYDTTVRLWDTGTGVALQTLKGHTNMINAVAFSPDGNTVASVSDDATVRLWDAETGAALQTLKGYTDKMRATDFLPDDVTVQLWDAETDAALQTFKGHTNVVNALAFSPDGKTVASASDDTTVRLWDAGTGAGLQILKGHKGAVNAVAFSPDSKTVASISDDETVRLWDAEVGAALQTLKGHTRKVHTVVFSPDGKTMVSISDNEIVRLWDAETGAALQTLKGHTYRVYAVTFSPDSKTVASASEDDTVRLWDAETGTTLQTLNGHRYRVRAVAFSPDGKMVASASDDETVRLWNAETGAALRRLKGHTRRVRAVAFSPDGKMVASASDDATVRLWETETGAVLQTIKYCLIQRLAFSKDGSYLETNRGLLHIQSNLTSLFARESQPHCSLFLRGNWITQGESNLLWLPSEYRPSCSESRGHLLLLGHRSGKVTFVESSPSGEIT